jgi:hypothetical protein
MALKKRVTPKRWRSKEAKEIVAAVQRAGGQVERTASGHLRVIGPGSARPGPVVSSKPRQALSGVHARNERAVRPELPEGPLIQFKPGSSCLSLTARDRDHLLHVAREWHGNAPRRRGSVPPGHCNGAITQKGSAWLPGRG